MADEVARNTDPSSIRNADWTPEEFAPFRSEGFQVFPGVIADGAIDAVRGFLSGQLADSLARLRSYGLPDGPEACGRAVSRLIAETPAALLPRDDMVLMTGHFPLDVRLSIALGDPARRRPTGAAGAPAAVA